MFETHFGFIRRPFTAAPDSQLFVAIEAARAALDEIQTCIRSGQGIAVLTAPTGTGKSMLCHSLLTQLDDDFSVSFVPSPGSTSTLGLLQAVYFGLGHRVRRKHGGLTACEMRHELAHSARSLQVESSGVVVVVDEAHLLHSDQLEEIRLLSNLTDRGCPLIRFFLAGDPELEERLLEPSLKAFGQRLRVQTYLETLTRAESEVFICDQLARAGAQNRQIFTAEAVQRIVHAADGIPRCLNQLCDESLSIAAAEGEPRVPVEIVNRALERLVQLPLSWNQTLSSADASTATASASGVDSPRPQTNVVEFGSLDDDEVYEHAELDLAAETDVVESAEAVCDSDHSLSGSDEESNSEETLFIDIGPLVEDEEVDILVDEPAIDSETTNATFRQGLPDVPATEAGSASQMSDVERADETSFVEEQVVDRYSAAAPRMETDQPVLDEISAVAPRFDAAVAPEDLLPGQHRRSGTADERSVYPVLQSMETLDQGVEDQWTAAASDAPVLMDDAGDTGSEEQLLDSCMETRREIASMLDSLESHVSESLADRYDIVMPDENPGSLSIPVAEDPDSPRERQINDRLRRVVDVERGRR